MLEVNDKPRLVKLHDKKYLSMLIVLLMLLTASVQLHAQQKLTAEGIAGRLRGRYWTVDKYGINDSIAVLLRSDSLYWRFGYMGLAFKRDGTFQEAGMRCANDRRPNSGKWSISNDTIHFTKENGEKIWSLKVVDVNGKRLIIKHR